MILLLKERICFLPGASSLLQTSHDAAPKIQNLLPSESQSFFYKQAIRLLLKDRICTLLGASSFLQTNHDATPKRQSSLIWEETKSCRSEWSPLVSISCSWDFVSIFRQSVQYVSDHWECFQLANQGRLSSESYQRLQTEFDAFFLRAVNYIYMSKR